MRVFISSAGLASRTFAKRLAEWLPNVLQYVETRGLEEVEAGKSILATIRRQAASRSDFAIFCLTDEAQRSPWLAFEAGILTARNEVRETPINIASILVNIKPGDLAGPLSSFPAFDSSRESIRNLCRTINAAASDDESIDIAKLDRSLELMWIDLNLSFNEARDRTLQAAKSRPIDDKIDEMLSLLRRMDAERDTSSASVSFVRAFDLDRAAMKALGVDPGTVMTSELVEQLRKTRNNLAHGAPRPSLTRTEVETAVLKQFRRWGRRDPEMEVDFVWKPDASQFDLYTDLPLTMEDMETLEDVVRANAPFTTISGVYSRPEGVFGSSEERVLFSKFAGIEPGAPASFIREEDDLDDTE